MGIQVAACLLSLFIDTKGESVQNIIEQGLNHYLRNAYIAYQNDVVSHERTYERFAKTFIRQNSVLTLREEPTANEFVELKYLFGSLFDLLIDNKKLVEHFFTESSFSVDDCTTLISMFERGECAHNIRHKGCINNGAKNLLSNDYELLAACANRFVLFREPITAEQLSSMLHGLSCTSVHSMNNYLVTFYFVLLHQQGWLPYTWQNIFETQNYIISSSREGIIKAQGYRSMKNKLNERGKCIGVYLKLEKAIQHAVYIIRSRR